MYMPLMVKLQRVVVLTASEAPPLGEAELQPIVREKLRGLEPFLAEAGQELVLLRQSQLLANPSAKPDWAAQLLASKTEQKLRCDLVISCLLDDELNASLLQFCQQHGILCNVVDQKAYCNTWFMGVAQTESLLLGVSSKGRCPYYAAQLRRKLQVYLEQCEPEGALLSECRRRLQQGTESLPAIGGKALHKALYSLHQSAAFATALATVQQQRELENSDPPSCKTVETLAAELLNHYQNQEMPQNT